MLLALALTALADIPPPPDYVETCTVALACEGREGVLCGDAYFGDREACEKKWAPEGYERACRTRGASTWDEVWCQAAAAAEPAPSEADEPAPSEPAPSEPAPSEPASSEADDGGPDEPEPQPSPEPEPQPPKTSRCSSVSVPPGAAVMLLPLFALFARRRRV